MSALDLSGGVVVVTGAASGIGRATALAFARRGAALALVDRDADGLADTAIDARALGVSVTEHSLDVADAEAVAALPEAVLADHGRVTVLVNAAGVALAGRFEELTMDEIRWLFEINVFGLIGLTKAFLPALTASGGQVANVSSLFGIIAPAEQTAYAASKFAVRGFSESLRHELEGTGVGVTVIHPGGVATAISRNARVAAGVADPEAASRQALRFERAFLTTPAEAVGEAIVGAVARRQPRLIVASGARAGTWLQRLMPVRYWRVLGRGYRRFTRR